MLFNYSLLLEALSHPHEVILMEFGAIVCYARQVFPAESKEGERDRRSEKERMRGGLRHKWTFRKNTTLATGQGSCSWLKSEHLLSLVQLSMCTVKYEEGRYSPTCKIEVLASHLADTAFWPDSCLHNSQSVRPVPLFTSSPPPFSSSLWHIQYNCSFSILLWNSRILGAQVQDCKTTPHRPWMLKQERRVSTHAGLQHLHFSHWHNPHVLFVPL